MELEKFFDVRNKIRYLKVLENNKCSTNIVIPIIIFQKTPEQSDASGIW